ncbi:M24 family metallopeptidase, partial [Vibrio tubiashii]|uniref:M24 family metallopeptidase n=2 Tax=Vibrio tubiashii TaxID=29498 RepID=UPI001EFD0B00
VRYFTGFHTQFWHSPTRPWFVIVPAEGKPIAIIPEIGASGMAGTWIDNIITWPSPRPEDDGISLVASALNSLPCRHGRVGATLGIESHLRMPVNNYLQLTTMVKKDFVDVSLEMHELRQIKSQAEIEKTREICRITNVGFKKVPQYAKAGMTEREICKQFRIDMLLEGADECPYIIAGSGPDGYDSIIMGPTDRIIEPGDVLIIDTGAVRDGYFSDFDRNWAFGHASEQTKAAYRATYEATTKGFEAAKPGAPTTDSEARRANDVAGSGPDGYDSIIMGPTDRIIEPGDVLIIDTGAVRDGYFSDFDRNWAFGHASEQTKAAYRATYEATTKGFEAAKPGAPTTDIYNAMWKVLEANGALGNDVGRLGHGLGMELTERPSNTATDNTVLKPGMVMTLEPGMVYAPGKSMVHEENIVITEDGAQWLSERAEPELIIIE